MWEWGEIETEKSGNRRNWELGKGRKWKHEQYKGKCGTWDGEHGNRGTREWWKVGNLKWEQGKSGNGRMWESGEVGIGGIGMVGNENRISNHGRKWEQ